MARAKISSPLDDRPEHLLARFGSVALQWQLRLHLVVGYPDITCTPRRSVSVRSVLGLVPRYRNGGFAENHNMYIRRQPCVGLQTACHTELSTRCAHLLMMRSSVLSQSIVQNPGIVLRPPLDAKPRRHADGAADECDCDQSGFEFGSHLAFLHSQCTAVPYTPKGWFRRILSLFNLKYSK